MTEELRACLAAMEACAGQCEAMVGREQEKRQALLDGDTPRLERVLQEQQAGMMALEALERKRLAAQEAAGFPREAGGDEMLARLGEGPDGAAFAALLARLRQSAGELRQLNQTSLEIAGRYLQLLERAAGGAGQVRPTYTPGKQPGRGRSGGGSFEQKV